MAPTTDLRLVVHANNDWLDSSGNNNHGTAYGATFTTAAKLGSHAGLFDDIDDFVAIAAHASLRPVRISIDAWVYKTGAGVVFGTFFYGGGSQSYGYGLSIEADNKLYFTLGIAPTYKQAVSADTIPSNVWTHIAGAYNGVDLRIYINGVLNGTPVAATTDILYTSAYAPRIGRDPAGALFPYGGRIDELIVRGYGLSASEITEIWNGGAGIEIGAAVAVAAATTTNGKINIVRSRKRREESEVLAVAKAFFKARG